MKTELSLQELAAELQRRSTAKKDYIAPQGQLAAKVVDGDVVVDGLSTDMPLTDHAHGQLSSALSIPKPYYDRMRAAEPKLLAANINTWLHADNDTTNRALRTADGESTAPRDRKLMVRTLDDKVRAFLSPRYRPLDNDDLAGPVLQTLIRLDAKVMSAALTEQRMYIKAILPQFSDELPAGLEWGVGHHIFAANETRRVVAAIVVQNSDVGASSLRIEPSVYTALCTNLAILKEAAMRKYHVGRVNSADVDYSLLRDDTRRATDQAFFLTVRDTLEHALTAERFAAAVEQIRTAGNRTIESTDLPKVVEVTAKRLALPDATQNDILSWLAKGGQINQYGLSSAITRAAQDVDSYELATDMERAGGEVLAWSEGEFVEISKAA